MAEPQHVGPSRLSLSSAGRVWARPPWRPRLRLSGHREARGEAGPPKEPGATVVSAAAADAADVAVCRDNGELAAIALPSGGVGGDRNRPLSGGSLGGGETRRWGWAPLGGGLDSDSPAAQGEMLLPPPV